MGGVEGLKRGDTGGGITSEGSVIIQVRTTRAGGDSGGRGGGQGRASADVQKVESRR